MPHLSLAQILFSQGFGTRRECAALAASGRVVHGAAALDDPQAPLDTDGLVLRIDGADWPYHARALIALNKPAGYECSRRPVHHPGVLTLLPPPLRTRGVQPVGRLDADTTGLLLLTDDGALLHRLTSPRHHVPKVYLARCADALTPAQLARLADGVLLRDEPAPLRAQALRRIDERTLEITLAEGKYHQVRRMVAAAGNHVAALHRCRIGAYALPAALAPGQWCWLDPAQVAG